MPREGFYRRVAMAMVLAVISDIHANLPALRVVWQAIDELSVDKLLCLGDLVGYNARPDACVAEVLSRTSHIVRGNHDKAAATLESLEWFNSVAREAIRWTRRHVEPATLRRLAELPKGPQEVGDGVVICHGTPMDEDRYMMDESTIEESFGCLFRSFPAARVCFSGHTHVPMAARMTPGGATATLVSRGGEFLLDKDAAYLINPGSVGQPRDGNPMASFGILDTERQTYRNVRLPYEIRETQTQNKAAGLPQELAERLAEGW